MSSFHRSGGFEETHSALVITELRPGRPPTGLGLLWHAVRRAVRVGTAHWIRLRYGQPLRLSATGRGTTPCSELMCHTLSLSPNKPFWRGRGHGRNPLLLRHPFRRRNRRVHAGPLPNCFHLLPSDLRERPERGHVPALLLVHLPGCRRDCALPSRT
jgi:hypothetical protein